MAEVGRVLIPKYPVRLFKRTAYLRHHHYVRRPVFAMPYMPFVNVNEAKVVVAVAPKRWFASISPESHRDCPAGRVRLRPDNRERSSYDGRNSFDHRSRRRRRWSRFRRDWDDGHE